VGRAGLVLSKKRPRPLRDCRSGHTRDCGRDAQPSWETGLLSRKRERIWLGNRRSEFDDWDEPEKKRLMLRLWLDVERKARPVVREIHIYENVGGRSGIDPQPGRMPAVAKYRAPDAEVRRHAAAE
jgi:hypothetical protein